MGLTVLVDGFMVPVGELARRDGVSPQAVSKMVKRLAEQHGLAVQRDRLGRVMAVNAAHYDMLRGRVGDPSKAQAPERPEAPLFAGNGNLSPPDPESYDEAIRRKTNYEAERARLRLAAAAGELIPASEVAQASAELGDMIVAVINRLPACADEVAIAVGREGAHGARVVLKAQVNSMRAAIAAAIDQALSAHAAPIS